MKRFLLLGAALLATVATTRAADPAAARKANTVVLDATGVKNLRIETVVAEPTDFEETVFALGRIEPKAGSVAVVASRISGRVVALTAVPGEEVAAGAELVRVESRQPGNPPPTIGLTAPQAGMVTQLAIRPGEPVEPDRALLEITDLREVFAVARVPEPLAGRIAPGVVARVTVAAAGGRPVEGVLVRFGPAADPVGGTIDAIFRLANADRALRPGMRAEFSIVVAKQAGVVSVPRSALQGEPAARFVYVKDFDLPHAFIRTPVVVGRSGGGRVEIVGGLLPADEVVTQGAYSLAFAGGGAVSLKAALDAAHGHAHNADGSEITPAPRGGDPVPPDGHDHAEGRERFWMGVSGALFVLLIAAVCRRRSAVASVAPAGGANP